MKAQSNFPLSTDPQRWKEGQMIYYYDHKYNGVQESEGTIDSMDGQRYTAEFIIIKSTDKADIEMALTRALLDPELEKCVVENIEVDAKSAIEVIKEYKADEITLDKISAILVKIPIKIKPLEEEIIIKGK